MSYYKFTRRMRQYVIEYLGKELVGENKYFDGAEWVKPPNDVYVMDAGDWDQQRFPVVVIGNINQRFTRLGFSQIQATIKEGTNAGMAVMQGRGNTTITLQCAALSQQEQQLLSDLVCRKLLLGGSYFLSKAVLLELPGIGSEGRAAREGSDKEDIWFATLNLPISADWVELIPKEIASEINVVFQLSSKLDGSGINTQREVDV